MAGRTRWSGAVAGGVAGVLVLALAGCQTGRGGADVPEDVLPGGSGDGTGGAGEYGLVLQVASGGGFVPIGWDFRQVPSLTVYGDGRAIVTGPVTLQYPGAALPNLRDVRLGDEAVAEILAAAEAAGLLGAAPDYGMPPVADVPTTTVTITAGGETYEHAVYALGMESAEMGPAEEAPVEGDGGEGDGAEGDGAEGDLPGAGAPVWDDGLTDAQREARATLAGFVQRANELVDAASAEGAEQPYEPQGAAFLAMPAGDWPGAEIAPTVLPWPLDGVALADATPCAAVTGAAAVPLLDVLHDADELTQFEQDGATYAVFVRPLLPHETSCADLGF